MIGLSAITAMPSSTTNCALIPRWARSAAAARAPVPRTSSSSPETIITVRRGLKPCFASASTPSNRVIREPLSSMEPRPQTAPSAMTPAKGGWVQSFSVPGVTGTTSWWAIRITGASEGSAPFQV